ncbi:MAG: hypothetical protein AAB871_02140 [Patescibacteria group bacterium]
MIVTFHNVTGTLVRRVQIDRVVFLDQLLARGWALYYAGAARAHSENRIEVNEAVRMLQKILPGEQRGSLEDLLAKSKLYQFDLLRILNHWGVASSLGEEAFANPSGLRCAGYSDGSIQVAGV